MNPDEFEAIKQHMESLRDDLKGLNFKCSDNRISPADYSFTCYAGDADFVFMWDGWNEDWCEPLIHITECAYDGRGARYVGHYDIKQAALIAVKEKLSIIQDYDK